jgi:endo-beta-N-acetylglucosaminidase D
MTTKTYLYDFILSTCKAKADRSDFIDIWFDTNGNPCLLCEKDKSICGFYKSLVDKGVIAESEFTLNCNEQSISVMALSTNSP